MIDFKLKTTLADIAEILSVRKETVSRWKKAGWLVCNRDGKPYLRESLASIVSRLSHLRDKRKQEEEKQKELTLEQASIDLKVAQKKKVEETLAKNRAAIEEAIASALLSSVAAQLLVIRNAIADHPDAASIIAAVEAASRKVAETAPGDLATEAEAETDEEEEADD